MKSHQVATMVCLLILRILAELLHLFFLYRQNFDFFCIIHVNAEALSNAALVSNVAHELCFKFKM